MYFKVVIATLLLPLLKTDCSEAEVNSCISGNPPFESQNLNFEYLKNRARNLLLVPEYKFACYGRVTQWGVFMPEHTTKLDPFKQYNADFQVWRRERNGTKLLNCYYFIGHNYFSGFYTEKTGRFVGTVPEDKHIKVQPFDIIGVTVSSKMQLYSEDYVDQIKMWYSATPLTPVPSSTTLCLTDDTDGNIKPTEDFMPLITAIVDTTGPPTSPPTVTMATLSTSLITTVQITTNIATIGTARTDPVTVTTTHTNPVTSDNTTINPVTMTTVHTNSHINITMATSTSTSPPSILGRYGVIVLTLSTTGVLILMITALLITVLVCYRWRRNMLNRQFLANRPLPPIPHNRDNNERYSEYYYSDQDFSDEEREQLYIRRNHAYNVQTLPPLRPPVDNLMERIDEQHSEDEGYERLPPVPVCGDYERL